MQQFQYHKVYIDLPKYHKIRPNSQSLCKGIELFRYNCYSSIMEGKGTIKSYELSYLLINLMIVLSPHLIKINLNNFIPLWIVKEYSLYKWNNNIIIYWKTFSIKYSNASLNSDYENRNMEIRVIISIWLSILTMRW